MKTIEIRGQKNGVFFFRHKDTHFIWVMSRIPYDSNKTMVSNRVLAVIINEQMEMARPLFGLIFSPSR